IFLWQSSGTHFFAFAAGMAPPTLIAACCLAGFTFLAFRPRSLQLHALQGPLEVRWPLLALSAACFAPFILLADLRHAPLALLFTALLFAVSFRRVFLRLDWPLLVVFMLMFVDLRLVGSLPWIRDLLARFDLRQPLTLYLSGAALSQAISNVPSTILLAGYSGDWRSLAWGVDIGGFGLAIGSLASLIALRLGRQPGSLRAFHLWSLPFLLLTLALTGVWLVVVGGG
ncbi:MAG TPA: citrate transporter, partial [Gammaproteobacteria bacterium]|nr:citrate transporter [Gammaproteobacteria bacterium]